MKLSKDLTMSEGNFYTPDEVKPLYGELIPAYQAAFAGEPWFEVSKCADTQVVQRCPGGFSQLGISRTCTTCGNCPTMNAYPNDELSERFSKLGITWPTFWYMEREDASVALAAVAWTASASQIVSEKYPDVPEMGEWLGNSFSKDVVWLDEVFANKHIRTRNNLSNFGAMVVGFVERLGSPILAYRTISPAMISAPVRDFGEKAEVFERKVDVPDRRDFVVINLEDKQ